MIKRLFFCVVGIISFFVLKGQPISDSFQVTHPKGIADSIWYEIRHFSGVTLIYLDFRHPRIIIAKENGTVITEIDGNDLVWKNPKWVSIRGWGKANDKLLFNLRSSVRNILVTADLSGTIIDKEKMKLKYDGKKYKIPIAGNFFFDSNEGLYYVPLRPKDFSWSSDCNKYYHDHAQLGLVNEKGKITSVIGGYSDLFQKDSCHGYASGFEIACDDSDKVAIQNDINSKLKIYDRDGRRLNQIQKFDTVPNVKSYQALLINEYHYLLITPEYRYLTYDEVNGKYLRQYRPAMSDTTSRDLEYEKMLKKYFDDELKACPSFSTQKEAQKKLLDSAPMYLQILSEEEKLEQSILLRGSIKHPIIYKTDEGFVWVADISDYRKSDGFMVYKTPISGKDE